MTTIVIASAARTFLESVLDGHPNVSVLHVVRSKHALQQLTADTTQVPDLIVTGLVLDRTTPIRHVDELYVQQDALRFVRETLQDRPKTRFVICSAHWHVRLVTKSYDEGARWIVRDHAQLTDEVVEGLARVAAGERLDPYGIDVVMANQWTASHDKRLSQFTTRDLEMVEALLVDAAYTDELVARLGLSALAGAYNRLSVLVKQGGFKDKEAMIAHAIAIGIAPVDRLVPGPPPLLDRPPARLRRLLKSGSQLLR